MNSWRACVFVIMFDLVLSECCMLSDLYLKVFRFGRFADFDPCCLSNDELMTRFVHVAHEPVCNQPIPVCTQNNKANQAINNSSFIFERNGLNFKHF